jgi:TolA-binding protein
MNRQNKNINGRSGRLTGSNSWKHTDHDILLSREDSALFDAFGEYMKGRLDLEEVRNDPSLPGIENVVREMISDYRANSTKNTDDENFIRDNFTGAEQERKMLDEISNIKLDIDKSNINEITVEWVKEWHEKRKNDAGKESKTGKIRDFIASSLEPEKSEPEIIPDKKEVNGIKRSLVIRYITLSAAAVIGVFILIRTLLPSSDPEKLYSSYYNPFNLISSVTRGNAENKADGYSAAVERYRAGDYQTAAAGFSNFLLNDTSVIAPRFFMGITQLAMGNYNQAVSLLQGVAGRSGEYHKEALWYLGLAYLKTGEKEKSVKCFDLLTKSSGFYSERSAEILRRLK